MTYYNILKISLWANSSQFRGLHLIAWDTITLPREKGALSVKDLHENCLYFTREESHALSKWS